MDHHGAVLDFSRLSSHPNHNAYKSINDLKPFLQIGTLLLSFACALPQAHGQNLSLVYGSAIDVAGTRLSLFTNAEKVGFDSTAKGLIALGYFDDGFDVATGSGTIHDSATLAAFLSNFNPLDSMSFDAATSPGFLKATAADVSGDGEGKLAYVLVLGGVTDFDNASSASGIGLYTDSSFGAIPAGTEPVPTLLEVNNLTLDTVILGTEHLSEALSGSQVGFTGNLYASQAVVPIVQNEAPTDLALDNATIAENGDADAVVGSLTLTDVDGSGDPVIITEGVGEKLWEFNAVSLTKAPPAIGSNESLYVATSAGKLISLNSTSAIQNWEFDLGGTVDYSGAPTIGSNGIIYVGSGSSKVFAVNATSGQKVWEFVTGSNHVWSSPAIGADGTVYIGSDDKKLYALNGSTGVKVWEFETNDIVTSGPAVGDGIVYFGSHDTKLYALDVTDGSLVWEFQAAHRIWASPALGDNDDVYIASNDKVYSLNATTGNLLWTTTLDGGEANSSPVLSPNGMLFIGSGDKNVYGINILNGNIKWKFATGGSVYSTPAVGADGTIYFGSLDGKFYALNGDSGLKLWEFELGANTESSPALGSDGILYIGLTDHRVFALQGSSGPADSPWPMFGQNAQHTSRAKPQPTYALVAGAGDTDNSAFTIDGNELKLTAPADFETKQTYSVRVEGTDPGGLTFAKALTVTVTNIDEAITDLVLSKYEFPEWSTGAPYDDEDHFYITAVDPDNVGIAGVTEVYTTVTVSGTFGSFFLKSDGSLWGMGQGAYLFAGINGPPYNEPRRIPDGTYTTGQDNGIAQILDLNGNVVAKAGWNPTDENMAAAVALDNEGNLSLTDTALSIPGVTKFAASHWGAIYLKSDGILYGHGDTGPDGQMGAGVAQGPAPQKVLLDQPPAYSLPLHPDYPDNAYFSISQNVIDARDPPGQAGVLDFEVKPIYKLLIRATETGGGTLDKEVILQLTDVNEAPTDLALDNATIAENGEAGAVVGSLTLSDPDGAADPVIITEGVGEKIWEFETQGSYPAIGSDGSVYVGSGKFYALDGQTGAKKWEFATGDDSTQSPSIGSDGTVYVGSFGSKIYALNDQTGAKKWEFETGAWVRSSPSIGTDGTVYVGSDKVYALDGQTGAKKWEFATGSDVPSSPTIGSDGTVYIGSEDSKVYALNGQTGTKQWEFATGGTVRASLAIGSDGMVYVGSADNKVYALDGQIGTKQWEFATGDAVFSSPVIGSDGTVYVGSFDKKVYALDGQTGTKQWEFATGSDVFSSPAIGSDGTVYVGSDKVYALDGQTGAKKWEFETGDGVESSLAIGSDGTVYVGSRDNKLYAIQGSSGPATDAPWPMFGQNSQRTGRAKPQSTYALVAGAGGTDNAAFTIDGNNLKLNAPADFEAKETYSLRVEGTDPGGLSFAKALTVTVTDVLENTAPVFTSNGGEDTAVVEVSEHQSWVSFIDASDANTEDQLTYQINGGADAAHFELTQGKVPGERPVQRLVANTPLLEITTGDVWGLTFSMGSREIAFSIVHSDNISEEVNENHSSVDGSSIETLVSGLKNGFRNKGVEAIDIGHTDDGRLVIESRASFTIRESIIGDYSFGFGADTLNTPRSYIGTVTSLPYPSPVDNDYSNWSIYDATMHHVGDLVYGTRSNGATELHVVTEDGLHLGESFDGFVALGHSMQLTKNSSPGTAVFVSGASFQPGDVVYDEHYGEYFLSRGDGNYAGNSTAAENAGNTQQFLGLGDTLSRIASAPLYSQEMVYARDDLVTFEDDQYVAKAVIEAGSSDPSSNTNWQRLSIAIPPEEGWLLAFKEAPDHETPLDEDANNVYEVMVRVSDGALSDSQMISVTVKDINEGSVSITLDSNTIAENEPADTAIGTLSAIDPDEGDTHSFTLTDPAQHPDNAHFTIDGDQLKAAASFGFETKASYTLNLQVADAGGLTFAQEVTIEVTDVNEAPTDLALDNATIAENGAADAIVGSLTLADVDGSAEPVIITEGVGEKIWEFETGGIINSSPAISTNGNIYFGSRDSKVYAINGENGQKLWEYTTGHQVTGSPSIGSDGTVYIGSEDKKLYALDGQTGTKLWDFETGSYISSAPAIGPDGTIFVGSRDSKVYAINGENGQKIWEFETGNYVFGSPAVSSNGKIYFGSYDKKLYALDTKTGNKIWEFLTGASIDSSPTIGSDGTVYIGSDDKKLYALDGHTGSKIWEFETGHNVNPSPVIGADGTIFIGSRDKKLYAINGQTGVKLWECEIGAEIFSTATIGGDGTLYLGGYDNKLYAINGGSGQKLWEFDTGNIIFSSVAIGTDGVVYFGSYDGKLYAIQGSSGPALDAPWPMFGQNAQHTGRKMPQPSYALVAGAGDTDNAAFTIDGNELKLTAPADFETKETYSVRVEGTDPGGLTFAKDLTVTVTDDDQEDTDGDGLTQAEELLLGTSDQQIDTDGDGFTDAEEIASGTNPTSVGEKPISEVETPIGIVADTTSDSDGDGIPDATETNIHGTDPAKADTDGDGLSDSQELALFTDPNVADSDGDGFNDGEEVAGVTDPLDTEEIPVGEGETTPGLVGDTSGDLDGDGISNAEETTIYGTDPAKADTDGDGLSDSQELALSTDPKVADSDGDGFNDGEEVAGVTDPLDTEEIPLGEGETVPGLVGDTSGDLDGDGISNAAETNIHGTDPAKSDTDGDGLSDSQELALFTDPKVADTDGDGFNDAAEVAGVTDPLDKDEFPVGEGETAPGLVGDTSGDLDGDGISNAEEITIYGTDPAMVDTDGDGLSDSQELALSTDPKVADSDGDGFNDGEELAGVTDPLDTEEIPLGEGETVPGLIGDTSGDLDGDGISNVEETTIYGTDPAKADTDGDGLSDSQELALSTDPKVADSDGDGFNDGEELAGVTDPLDTDEFPVGEGESLPELTAGTINADPTGIVAIIGMLADGQVLTADISTLADADGLGTITFQWNRDGVPIDGAMGTTYTLTPTDIGKVMTVTASYGDHGRTTESVTSAATAVVIAANAVPVITSTDAVDAVENQFTAATVVATDADQGDTLTYSLTGGVDASLFDLDGATGALTFKSAPDFESPADTDGNNTYVVEITVGDGTDTALQTLTVTVGNLFAPLVETLLPGADNRLSGRLHPDGGLSVTSTGFRISGSPFHSDGDTRFVEAEDLGPDGGFSALVTGLTPGTTYYYQAFAINAEGTGYGVLKKFLAPRPSVASGPWGDAIPIAGSGWYQTAIGLVYLPGEQWAYHQHLGWVYVQGNSPEDIWLWMEGSGWYWTARQYYPYIYRDSLPGWVYLLRSIGGTPVFYNTVSGQVEYGSGP